MIDFNANGYVYVRLNNIGRNNLIKKAFELRKKNPGFTDVYELPNEDADGWSKWQLWSLMENFGCMMGMGGIPPFCLDIRIETKEVKDDG